MFMNSFLIVSYVVTKCVKHHPLFIKVVLEIRKYRLSTVSINTKTKGYTAMVLERRQCQANVYHPTVKILNIGTCMSEQTV